MVAAVYDLRTRRIPNRLTFSVLGLALIWAIWAGGLNGLLESIIACVILASPFVVLFVFAGGGAGDAKLMGALGAWLGIVDGLVTLVVVIVVGALWGLTLAVAKKQFRPVLSRVMVMIRTMTLLAVTRTGPTEASKYFPSEERMVPMTYAFPIFLGLCVAAIGVSL
jgi:prepilin peptidase CpaA